MSDNQQFAICEYCKYRTVVPRQRRVRCNHPDNQAAIQTRLGTFTILCEAFDGCDKWEQRTRTYDVDDVLNFGKFKGASVAYIAACEKEYFKWLVTSTDYAKFTEGVWEIFLGEDNELEEWRSTTVTSE